MAEEISSRREHMTGASERTEIRSRFAKPSRAPEHCIETIIEQSATDRRASKLLAIYLTPDEAIRWAERLVAAATEARGEPS